MEIDEAVAVIESNPDFRLLRKYKTPKKMYSGPTGREIRRGLYVDTETTGTDTKKADLLELALVPFIYEHGGRLLGIREDQCMAFLQDPGRPLDDNIRKLTGIADEDLAGRSIDWDLVCTMLAGTDLVVAHYASFDRQILERFHPGFAALKWACSQQDVPWKEVFHAPAERLEIIAQFLGGVFYPAHRAMIDCLIGVHCLASIEINGKTAFEYLEENSERESVRIWATGAPFSTKDALSVSGYRWNDGRDGRPKAWHKLIPPEQLDAETQWLRVNCGAYPQVTTCEAIDRYSVRDK